MAVATPSLFERELSTAAPRRGRIVVQNGRLIRLDRLWLTGGTSISRVWLDTRFRLGGTPDRCALTYRGTRSVPGYLSVEYVRSGPRTRLATIQGVLAVLDRIARLRQCVAMVAHISTWAISDRALERFGWELQRSPRTGNRSDRLSGRHWIKRFYNGYPEHDWERYCRTSPARIKR